jgi:hypothetical protein
MPFDAGTLYWLCCFRTVPLDRSHIEGTCLRGMLCLRFVCLERDVRCDLLHIKRLKVQRIQRVRRFDWHLELHLRVVVL